VAQVRDPVCDMMVEPAEAAGSSTWQGKTWYFCSTMCQKSFDADPAKFVAPSEPPFTTTGPLTAPKFGSAGSGGAEDEPGPGRRRGG